jgi:hypothetical protein
VRQQSHHFSRLVVPRMIAPEQEVHNTNRKLTKNFITLVEQIISFTDNIAALAETNYSRGFWKHIFVTKLYKSPWKKK